MRILLLIVMILACLVATGIGLFIGQNNLFSEEAVKAAELLKGFGDSELAKPLVGLRTAGWGGLVVGILALVTVVVTFMKKTKVINIVAGATAVLAVLFIVLSPTIELGKNAGFGPKQQAMVYGIAAMIVAACAFMAEKMRLSKAD